MHWQTQDWFYDDAVKDKRAAALAVLRDWNMVAPVLARAEALRAELLSENTARPRHPRSRRPQPVQRDKPPPGGSTHAAGRLSPP